MLGQPVLWVHERRYVPLVAVLVATMALFAAAVSVKPLAAVGPGRGKRARHLR
jgi:hypothetical protein